MVNKPGLVRHSAEDCPGKRMVIVVKTCFGKGALVQMMSNFTSTVVAMGGGGLHV